MQTTRPAPRERVGGRHTSPRVPPLGELLFLLGVVVPLVGTVCAVCGALGLLAALWTVA